MKKIELVPGVSSSVLGFGCAPIMGAVDGKKAARAIAVAIESGINHFDLARSYGYGEAEKFVGKQLASTRKDMVIATKFGIRANWKAKLIQPVKPMLRTVLSQLKKSTAEGQIASKNVGAAQAGHFLNRVAINPATMVKSLEESLRNLKTDYVDYLFIHEPLTTIAEIEQVLETGDKLKQAGKLRALGLAYMLEQATLHASYLGRFDLLQFNRPAHTDQYLAIKQARGHKANILFSPLRGSDPKFSAEDRLLSLHDDFQNSVILCSMFNEHHIRSNSNLNFR